MSISTHSNSDPISLRVQSLVEEINRTSNLTSIYQKVEDGIEIYESETGGTADELLPPNAEPLAFQSPSLERGKEFLHKLLCTSDNRIRDELRDLQGILMPFLVRSIIEALRLGNTIIPPGVEEIAEIIAALFIANRLNNFCTSDDQDL